MKLSKNANSFEPCPEFSGTAVCVDVTPLKKTQTAFGSKDTFRVVFETPMLREDGTPYCVWSRGFTPSLHEKSAFAQFVRKWFGRALTAAEESEFDTETLIGKAADITVVHEDGRNGEVYANIALIRPDKTGKGMKPTGKFKRVKDRTERDGTGNGASDAEYRRAEQDDDAENAGGSADGDTPDWRRTKVHVGRHSGLDLGDLDRVAVTNLFTNWIPQAKAKPKLLADDRRLITALEAAKAELDAEDAIPMDDQPF